MALDQNNKKQRTTGLTFSTRQVGEVRSHRPWVRGVKFILPATALIGLMLALGWPLLASNSHFLAGVNFSLLFQDRIDELRIKEVRFVSTDGDDQPFALTADEIYQIENALYKMEQPKADLMMAEGNWALITAEQGHYNEQEKLIELKGNVELFHDLGYELYTDSLFLDLDSDRIKGTKPVEGQGTSGFFEGEQLEIREKGRKFKLLGKSHVKLYLSSDSTIAE